MGPSEIVLRFSIFFFQQLYVSAMHRILAQNMFNMKIYASANMAENNPKTPSGCMISDILTKICSVCKYMGQAVSYASYMDQNTFNTERYASANMAENNPKNSEWMQSDA